jgi:hypothetical protein
VNLVFIGFNGDGHYKLNLAEETLKPWFEHMEHKIMHTVVPPSDGAEESPSPKPSHIYYRYNLHVLPDLRCCLRSACISVWDSPMGRTGTSWALVITLSSEKSAVAGVGVAP